MIESGSLILANEVFTVILYLGKVSRVGLGPQKSLTLSNVSVLVLGINFDKNIAVLTNGLCS